MIYYQDDSVTLYHGDWRELIAPDFRADLIVTDPPYGETSLDWDRWPDGWVSLAARHADAMWCWGSMRMFLDRAAEFSDWKLAQDLVWEKQNGTGFHADRFKRVHEHAVHWYRGDWSDVHHDAQTTPDATPRVTRRKTRPTHTGNIEAQAYQSFDGGPRLARSVIYAPNLHGTAINETEKPEGILEMLVAYGCPTGGTVVDFYAGSGSTGEACKLTGRKAVLFEKREQQCYEAAKRLSRNVLDFGATA